MRKFDWSILVTLTCGFGIPYFLGFLPYSFGLKIGYVLPDHFLALSGGLGFTVFLFAGCTLNIYSKLSSEKNDQRPWWEKILSGLGLFSLLLLLMTSMMLSIASPMVVSYNVTDLIMGRSPISYGRFYWLTEVNFFLLLYSLFCIFFLWSRKTVAPNEVIIFNDVVYYPGDRYFVNPFFKNNLEIIAIAEEG